MNAVCYKIQYNTIQYTAMQYNAIQYNTIQYNAMQCNAMQCNAMQCNAIQYNAMQCNAMQCNTIQCNAIQYNTIQYNTIQYNAIQYNTIFVSVRNENGWEWKWEWFDGSGKRIGTRKSFPYTSTREIIPCSPTFKRMALPLNVVHNYSSRFGQQFYIFRVEKAIKGDTAVEIEAGTR